MSFKELYALCAALIMDRRTPVMTQVIRSILEEFANRHARRHGFQDWEDFHSRIDNPLPLIVVQTSSEASP
jgi:hypothetical protein